MPAPIIGAAGLAVLLGWISRVVISKLILLFGVSVVSYVGLQQVFAELKSYFYTGYNSLPSDLLSLLDIGGFTAGIAILFAGVNIRISMYVWDRVEMAVGLGGKP